eukprot:2499541-Rhodomonas_salina.5
MQWDDEMRAGVMRVCLSVARRAWRPLQHGCVSGASADMQTRGRACDGMRCQSFRQCVAKRVMACVEKASDMVSGAQKMKDDLIVSKDSFRAHLVQAEFTK